MNYKFIPYLSLFAAGLIASPVTAQTQQTLTAQLLVPTTSSPSSVSHHDTITRRFTPRPNGKNVRLDYSVLDAAFSGTVIRFGPSLRRRASRPEAPTGSRFVTGHKSAYRLEGSRISFSFLHNDYLDELVAYRKDLERIATQINLTAMPKSEQLAFWFNIHNVAIIEQITKKYPVTRPSKIKINGIPLDEAKVLTIKGVALSPRDIRQKIVFPHWKNPSVIYGFFHGDIGSPQLQNYAYTRANLNNTLQIQATEFVNSLRGFNKSRKNRRISKLYEETTPFYFPDFENDMQRHLLNFARDNVAEDIRSTLPFAYDRYDDVVADLVGGSRPRIATANVINGNTGVPRDFTSIPPEVRRLLEELNTKADALKRRNLIGSGTVTIEDIETVDPDAPETYDPNVDPASALYVSPDN